MYLDFRGGRGVKKNTLYIVLQLLWPFSAGSLLDSLLGQYCLYSALLWAAEEEKSGTQWIPRDWCWVRHLIGTACVTWSCMEIATILLLLPPGPGFRCDFILLVCTNKSWHGGFELNQALFIQYIFTTSTSKLNPLFLITVDLRQKVDPAQYHLNEYCSSWRVLVWMLCSSWNTMNDCEKFFYLWSAAVFSFLNCGGVSEFF